MCTARQLTPKQIDSNRHREADRGNERAASLISEIATLECPHPYMQPAENYRKLKQALWRGKTNKNHKSKYIYLHLYFYSTIRRKY